MSAEDSPFFDEHGVLGSGKNQFVMPDVTITGGSALPQYAGQQEQQAKVPSDPWVHRANGMRCKTCMWFVPKVASAKLGVTDLGRCRRHAPVMGGFPVVFVNDFCGDHRIDENKF